MRIMLINYPSRKLDEFPIGLSCLYAYAVQQGIDMEFWDFNFSREKGFDIFLKELNPDDRNLIFLTMLSPERFFVREISRMLKERDPACIICAGGAHPTLDAGDTLRRCPNIDFLIRGEGEITMVESIRAMEHNFSIGALKDISGVSWMESPELTVHNSDRERIRDLDSLPFPDRGIIDSRYAVFINTCNDGKRKAEYIVASRGCCFGCTFCSASRQWNREISSRSNGNIIEEMRMLREKGSRYFYFTDVLFTSDRKRVIDFCGLLKKEIPDALWLCEARADTVDRYMLERMHDAGCRAIQFGIESGSQRILNDVVNKQIDLEYASKVIKWCNDIGIFVNGMFIYSYPTELYDDVMMTMDFIKNNRIDSVSFGILYAFPGTPLYYYMEKHNLLPHKFTWWTYYSDYAKTQDDYVYNMPICRDKLTDGDFIKINRQLWKDRKMPSLSVIFKKISRASFRDMRYYLQVGMGMIIKIGGKENG